MILNDLDEEDIYGEDREIVDAIMEEEYLDYLHELDIGYKTLRSGSREFEWFNDDEDAEDMARESLEEGELWRMEVESGHTTDGLDDWIEWVLRSDGWGATLCGYDGLERECKTKSGKYIPYIRRN